VARTSILEELLSRLEGDASTKDAIRDMLRFGLVYEDSQPEVLRLTGLSPIVGCRVDHASPEIHRFGTVVRVPAGTEVESGGRAVVWDDDPERIDYVPEHDLVPIAAPTEPVYPGLEVIETITKGQADAPHHLAIEGENFHALQTLRYTHTGKVDVIYIDPPYNTGGDLIYNDKYVSKEDSFRHSKWLSFMESRLRLARELLAPHGVIAIHIDDREQAHLRLLMDDVFGSHQFLATAIWRGRGGGNDSSKYNRQHEYVLLYCKDKERVMVGRNDDAPQRKYNKVTEDGRRYKTQLLRKWGSNSLRSDRPNLYYPIVAPDGSDLYPLHDDGTEGCWRWKRERMDRAIAEGVVEFVRKDGVWVAYERVWAPVDDAADEDTAHSTLIPDGVGAPGAGARKLKSVLGDKRFKYPKPIDLCQHIINMATPRTDAVILDFFGGSGSTLHAVLEMNAADGGNRQCILITNNELKAAERKRLADAGHYPGDPEYDQHGIFRHVTYPRIKTVVTGVREDGSTYSDGLDANVTFARLTYTNRATVSLGRAFGQIAPLLWLKAGARGPVIGADAITEAYAATENYAVIFDASESVIEAFVRESAASLPERAHIFIVTDDEDQFARANAALSQFECVRLYRSYLTNFEVRA